MNNAPSNTGSTASQVRTTALDQHERLRGATSRKVAFAAIAAISVISCLVAVLSWYVWIVTVRACFDAYILQTVEPPLLSGERLGWLETFSSLDISSFSALILALLFTRLAYVGCGNIWQWWRYNRAAYFEHAHHSVLFSEGFDTLAIRLGLLGTLLSFLLAALTQMSDVSVRVSMEVSPDKAITLEDRVDAVAAEETDATSSLTQSDDMSASLDSSQLSGHMFLLLCASLVSTFVGTGVAYVITPSLNWLNDHAVGRHQIGDVDAEIAADEFWRQIVQTTERLAEFQTTSVKLTEAAEHMTSFEVNVGNAATHLGRLLKSLDTAIVAFDVSNRNSHELAGKLDSMERQFAQLRDLLQHLPDRVNSPLESISRSSSRIKDAAQAGEVAFRELKSAAGAAHESLHETTQRSKVMWKLLHEVRDSMAELAQSERLQTNELGRLREAFESTGSLLREIQEGQVAESDGRTVGVGAVAAEPYGMSRTGDGDMSGTGGSSRQPQYHPARRHARPWWRRWIG